MIVGVPAETFPGEQRVALVPAVLPSLKKASLEVLVQQGAGSKAGFPDAAFQEQGARLVGSRSELFSSSDIIVQVRSLGANLEQEPPDLELMRPRQVLVGLLNPLGDPQAAKALAARGVSGFAMELLPRISRAQPMDVLSSMATIGGYKAVLLAASTLPKMFPMLMTAAGTVTPARVFILGAGVAGLQAIATARRLGAVVHAYDVRPEVKQQVESLGARFVELPLESEQAAGAGGYARAMDEEFYRRQRELMARVMAESDVVISTAAIPGRRAPVLITRDMVSQMRPGSVIVDLAADSGGNCEATRPGETVEVNGVKVLGAVNVASTVPYHASQMYARNVSAFLLNLVRDGQLRLNLEDPIIRDTLIVHQGEVTNPQVRELLGLPGGSPA
ncbi:MAG: Re/Si-specific NAD(P)(+) transhydrogenase subunit alpha [Chloroflexi bacterium]|nr:Re/Si-specific NAD(P)(+) transhydrogenase subunit alpha [Chloroflexota bacterium]